jgi:hypothetical protein
MSGEINISAAVSAVARERMVKSPAPGAGKNRLSVLLAVGEETGLPDRAIAMGASHNNLPAYPLCILRGQKNEKRYL